jgi:hypothetical protein
VRARWRGLTSGDGMSGVRGHEFGVGRRWAEGGRKIASARGGSGRGRGLDLAQLGGREGFLFFFLFSKFYIHFLYPFLLNN